jgi:hypothetical protein
MFRINRLNLNFYNLNKKVSLLFFLARSEIIYYAFLQIDWLRERSVSARPDRAIFKAIDPVPFLFLKI